MRFSCHATKLVLLLMAFAAAASALVLPNSANDIHNSDRGAKLVCRQTKKWTWQEIQQGSIRNRNYRTSTLGAVSSIFHETIFYGGQPVIFFNGKSEEVLPDGLAQHAFANFNGFHALETNSQEVMTVKPQGVAAANDGVKQGVRNVYHTHRNFGRDAAKLAYTSSVYALPPRRIGFFEKPQQAPKWKVVLTGEANPRGDFLTLKEQLDRQRHLRFEDSLGTKSLNIRANPDGSIERQFWDLVNKKEIMNLRL
ncbi:hypothetical protein NDA10_004077 [Ustilago hordei]|nr:hypothetical protein NDA10_004077 [Ustilago hordei]KAJ1573159.1 hypothetical protein NDA12_007624 [Ustilago hordei]KAJ1582140.1 hypothetical protein NDA15_003570 [Ustilago hordei]